MMFHWYVLVGKFVINLFLDISGFFQIFFYICFVFGFICFLWSIVFSISNVLVLGCFLFVINLCEPPLPFSSDLFLYCSWIFTYLLMLTIFHVENVLIILWLCDFIVPKHIHELDTLHLHWSFTDVDIFSCGKCSIHSGLMIMWFSL